MQTLSFSYRLKRWPLLLSLPVVAFMVFSLYGRVAGPPESVQLLHIIELRGGAATAFHMLGLAFFGAGLLMLLVGLLGSFGPPRLIELREDVARLPRSVFSPRVIEIAYNRIYGLEVQRLGRQRILRIQHVGGKIGLSSMALSDPQAFELIVRTLAQKSRVAPQVVQVG